MPRDTTLDTVFDPCAGVVIAAANANDAELTSIQRALEMWTAAGAFNLTQSTDRAWPRLELRFEEAPMAQLGVYDDETGVVYINRRLAQSQTRTITIAHELGHAFGLWHVSGRRSLMNEHNVTVGPTEQDVDGVYEEWPSCAQSNAELDASEPE